MNVLKLVRTLSNGILLSLVGSAGYADTVDEAELKTAIIYKLAQFTSRPDIASGDWTFCVVGNQAMELSLSRLNITKVHGTNISVHSPDSPSDAKACTVIFISTTKLDEISKWLSGLQGLPVLTVSDNPYAWDEHVMIMLVSDPNCITFNFDTSVAKQVGISFRAAMLQIAREVR